MKKILMLSISLAVFSSSCSSDSEVQGESNINKEQRVSENSLVDLAIGSIELTNTYEEVNGLGQSVPEVINQVEDLAVRPAFLNQHSLQSNSFVLISESTINKILSLDESVLNGREFSNSFRSQLNDILSVTSEDINLYLDVINRNDQLRPSEKKILIDAINFSNISSDHGVDDEWRKRKIMGYVIAQENSELNVVVTTTVLNIAMKQ